MNAARATRATRDGTVISAPADAAAFHDVLALLSSAVRSRIDGDTLTASLTQMTATGAALRAFPVGSPESVALGRLMGAAMLVTAEVPS